jgi:hypothetical protein
VSRARSRRRHNTTGTVSHQASVGGASWEPYRQSGRCESCSASATWALVRLHPLGTVAVSLVRLACEAHR